jgi:hypothetical protein
VTNVVTGVDETREEGSDPLDKGVADTFAFIKGAASRCTSLRLPQQEVIDFRRFDVLLNTSTHTVPSIEVDVLQGRFLERIAPRADPSSQMSLPRV